MGGRAGVRAPRATRRLRRSLGGHRRAGSPASLTGAPAGSDGAARVRRPRAAGAAARHPGARTAGATGSERPLRRRRQPDDRRDLGLGVVPLPDRPGRTDRTGQHPSDHPTLHPSPSDNASQPGGVRSSYVRGRRVRGRRAADEPGRGQRSATHRSAHERPTTSRARTGPPSASGAAPTGFPPPDRAHRPTRHPTYPPPGYPPAGYPPDAVPVWRVRSGRGVRSGRPAVPTAGSVPRQRTVRGPRHAAVVRSRATTSSPPRHPRPRPPAR